MQILKRAHQSYSVGLNIPPFSGVIRQIVQIKPIYFVSYNRLVFDFSFVLYYKGRKDVTLM
jgi:hypothetical protein